MYEAVEVCPWCGCENVFSDCNVEESGYVATCWQCGKKIFLCDECMHAEDNPGMRCDWHETHCGKKYVEGHCFRGTTRNEKTEEDERFYV